MTAAKIPKRKADLGWIKLSGYIWDLLPGAAPGSSSPCCFLGKGKALKAVPRGLSPSNPCSYCHLTATFSVYVYGAFPMPFFMPEITIFLLMLSILLSVWLAYMIPKLLHTELGHRLRGLWVSLCNRCRRSCACFQCWH